MWTQVFSFYFKAYVLSYYTVVLLHHKKGKNKTKEWHEEA